MSCTGSSRRGQSPARRYSERTGTEEERLNCRSPPALNKINHEHRHSRCRPRQAHAFNLPKVLHPIAGKPLAQHVIDTAHCLTRKADRRRLWPRRRNRPLHPAPADDIAWAEQAQQLGTGHAVAQAVSQLGGAAQTLVLYGDVPLTTVHTLKRCCRPARTACRCSPSIWTTRPATAASCAIRPATWSASSRRRTRRPSRRRSARSIPASWPSRRPAWPTGWAS